MKQIEHITIEELKELSKEELIKRAKEIKAAMVERVNIRDSTEHSPDFFQAIQQLEILDRMLHDLVGVLGFDPTEPQNIGRTK
jgi:hypothetical protein